MPILYILAGPTASGKTRYAIQFARLHHCEILSCDASSFYRGMDIGTAKPTLKEQHEIPHWGIDLIYPCDPFSIKDYIRYAQDCIRNIRKRGKNVLVVGGSGFYLKSFLEPLVDTIQPSPQVKQALSYLEAQGGAPALAQALYEINKTLPPHFDLHNPRKVKKALERCLTTGLPLMELERQLRQQKAPFAEFKKVVLCLCKPLEVLKARIRLRTHTMVHSGLIDEVQGLKTRLLLKPNTPAGLAIGYRETLDFLKHPTSMLHLEQSINQNTYALVKKQLTWFRHQIHFDRYIY